MKQYDKKKQEQQIIKSLTISRYTFLRYFTTIVFFMSLYWFISSLLAKMRGEIIIPILIGISQILVNAEIYNAIQFRNNGNLNKSFYVLLVDLLILFISFFITLNNYKVIFPYLINRNFALIFLILLIVLVILCLYRVYKIRNRTDKIYKKIKDLKDKRGKYV